MQACTLTDAEIVTNWRVLLLLSLTLTAGNNLSRATQRQKIEEYSRCYF